MLRKRRAQEEMIGFVLIVIIVAVILLILLAFSIKNSKKNAVESYEASNFIQAVLQYTTDCRSYNDLEYFSIKKLISECEDGELCLDERKTCEVLEESLTEIVKKSWIVVEGSPIKAYDLQILSKGDLVINLTEGEKTKNAKGSMQSLPQGDVYFTVYF